MKIKKICFFITLMISMFLLNDTIFAHPLAFVEEEIRGIPVLLESPLGNLFADAMRFQTGAEIAFIPNGHIGAGYPRGPLTEDILIHGLVYPDDHIVTTYLRGSEIWQILEQSLSLHPHPNVRFLQISGIKFDFSTQLEPIVNGGKGHLRNVFINGQLLDRERTYRSAMLLPMAQGFLGYPPFGRDITNTNVSIAQAVSSFARIKQVLRYGIEGRINVIP